MNFKRSGFSIVEMMVGMAIASGIGLILMRQQETASKIQLKASANQSLNSEASVIQTVLSDRAVCSTSLSGKKPGDPDPKLSTVDKLLNAKLNPNYGKAGESEFIIDTSKNLVSVNSAIPGDINITAMALIVDQGKEYLKVSFDLDSKGTKSMFGGREISKLFQIITNKDKAGLITSCSSTESNIVTEAVQESCKAMGASWNVPMNQCELTNLPSCILTTSACAGVFNLSQGQQLQIPVTGGTLESKVCTRTFNLISTSCASSVSSKDFSCQCGGETGVACDCEPSSYNSSCWSPQGSLNCVVSGSANAQTIPVNICCRPVITIPHAPWGNYFGP